MRELDSKNYLDANPRILKMAANLLEDKVDITDYGFDDYGNWYEGQQKNNLYHGQGTLVLSNKTKSVVPAYQNSSLHICNSTNTNS